ncbi:P protein-like [Pectinophora gossypiella]|uniref:P protein-like n=1 Tax=Pectinophora gossypiella TaxID=13191 RepID=UPI00214E80CF|nr:P protein-like [Pectinophora gossypiella]
MGTVLTTAHHMVLSSLVVCPQTNRILALFVIAAVCVSILSYLQLKPEPEVIAVWLNLDYVFELVFVMMVVAATVDTGFYDLVAFKIYDLTNGAIFGITSILCVCTFVLAVIMDCVVAIMLVTPLAIRTMEHGKMNPMPVLMSMILYCNMAAVLDADYNYVNHNIIKGRDRWQATDTAFEDTKIHQKTMPGVVVAAAATTLYILFVFKKLRPYAYNSPEVTMLMHRQTLLRMAASSVNRNSKSWEAIRNQLVEWHHEVDQERLRRLADDGPAPINKRFNKISDMTLLLKIGLVLGIFCALFLLRRYRLLGLGTVSISMLVAVCTGYLLLLLNPHDLNSLLRRCQWTTIMAILCIFFIERSFETMRLNKRLFQFLLGLVPDDKTSAPFYVVRYLQWVS